MSKLLTARFLKGRSLTTCVIATAAALALSNAAVTPSFAATHHKAARAQSYNYHTIGEGDPPPGMTAGQVGHRINPTLPGGNGFGPPDPASCGGFNC
jgi:uncharacterized membrane protein